MSSRFYSSVLGKPHKSKKELAARIDEKLRSLRLHAGPNEFDPVEMMAIIGAEAYDEGDKHLALVAFKEMAQYVRPRLAPKQFEEKPEVENPEVKRDRILDRLQSMGVPIERMDDVTIPGVEDAMLIEDHRDDD